MNPEVQTPAVFSAPVGTVQSYRARHGSHLSDEQAREVARFIEDLRAKGVEVTADNILEHVIPGTPIYELLEWDDTKAAKEYRLQQVRTVLTSIEVVIKKPDGAEVVTRAYQAVFPQPTQRISESTMRVYVPVLEISRDVGYSAQVLSRAKAGLEHWLREFSNLEDLAASVPHVRAALRLVPKP